MKSHADDVPSLRVDLRRKRIVKAGFEHGCKRINSGAKLPKRNRKYDLGMYKEKEIKEGTAWPIWPFRRMLDNGHGAFRCDCCSVIRCLHEIAMAWRPNSARLGCVTRLVRNDSATFFSLADLSMRHCGRQHCLEA